MSDRPTPEHVIAVLGELAAANPTGLLEQRAEKMAEALDGCVIVHPDDVPPHPGPDVLGDRYRLGYNDCRRHIFAAAVEREVPSCD